MRSIIAGAIAALAFSGPTFAGPITVDGNVSDWGITVKDGNLSNFSTPAVAGTTLNSTFFFAREDNNDFWGDSGYLGPNYGGQNYDVEFMGLAFDGAKVYLTIVTGQRPDNGLQKFSPGDIRIVAKTSKTGSVKAVYGIEVGGGPGGAPGLGALTESTGNAVAPGSTYSVNATGFTTGHTASARGVGSLWKDPNWLLDPIPPKTDVQLKDDGSGQYIATADFVYTRNETATAQHSVIELALDRSVFADAGALDIYWAPSCGNDVLEINDDLPSPARVPEPGTLAALGLGFFALRFARRKH